MQLVDELYDFVQQKHIQPRRKAREPRAERKRMSPPERLNMALFVGFVVFFIGGLLAVALTTPLTGPWSLLLLAIWGLISRAWFVFGSWHAEKYDKLEAGNGLSR